MGTVLRYGDTPLSEECPHVPEAQRRAEGKTMEPSPWRSGHSANKQDYVVVLIIHEYMEVLVWQQL